MSAHRWLRSGAARPARLLLMAAAVLASLAVVPAPGAAAAKKIVWNFESDEPGKIPQGFSGEVGRWEVADDGGNRVLFQKGKSEDAVLNVALARDTRLRNVDLSVRLMPVAGEVDRGGGLVWRARDKNNYYLCRYNPLEDNYRLFRVVDGVRKQLKSVKVPSDNAWHTLRATMSGSSIACYLDGKKLLEADDATFPDAGMIGLWTKADAQSYFDDLTVAGE